MFSQPAFFLSFCLWDIHKNLKKLARTGLLGIRPANGTSVCATCIKQIVLNGYTVSFIC